MANQITVNSGTGNITVTTSRSVIGTVANVASANYANFAGEAFSVDAANIVGPVSTAGTVITNAQPNITSVGNLSNLNVVGTTTTGNLVVLGNLQVGNLVANSANYANFAGNAFNVSVGNVSGIGNIATVNLDGNSSNVLKGDGTFGPEGSTGNANYANFAGTAYSVSGSNVSGAVANANFANDAANANIANTAYSVDVANVSGIGNIATINLDGNANNILDGTGNWVTIPSGGNSNYSNFAGEVVTNAQPNITSVGNLVSLTVDANVANTTTVQMNGNLLTYSNTNAYSITKAFDIGGGVGDYTTDVKTIVGATDEQGFTTKYYLDNALGGYFSANLVGPVGNSGTDPLVESNFLFTTYNAGGNLANINTQTYTSYSIGGAGTFLNVAAPQNAPALQVQVYGNGGQGQQGLRFRRRGGNNDARTGVIAGDYLGNIEWQGAATSTGGYNANSTTAKIAPKVESTYSGAGTGPIPTGIEFIVSNGTTTTHSFNSNGTVTLGTLTTLNANTTSNIGLTGNGGSVVSYSIDNANTGLSSRLDHLNTVTENFSRVTTNRNGVEFFIANTNSGNSSPGNIKGYWRFTNTGNLDHLFGGTGGINAKLANLGTGNLTAGNVNATYLYGDGSNITGLPGASAAGSNTEIQYNNSGSFGASSAFTFDSGSNILNVNGRINGFTAAFTGESGGAIQTNIDNIVNCPDIAFNRFDNNSYVNNYSVYRARGTFASPTNVQSGDSLFQIYTSAYSNVGYEYAAAGSFAMTVNTNDNAGNITVNTSYNAAVPTGSTFNIGYDDFTTSGNAVIGQNGTGNLQVNGQAYVGSYISLNGFNRSISLNGDGNGSSNVSGFNVNNGTVTVNMDNVPAGYASFAFSTYEDVNGYINPYTFYRARGNLSNPNNTQAGDAVKAEYYNAYGDSGNTYVSLGSTIVTVKNNDNAGNVSSTIQIQTANNNDGSEINLNTDIINLDGNVSTPYTVNIAGNTSLYANGRIDYLRTFGSFTSNATQTSNGANTTNYMTFNNTEDANGISIANSTEITVARTGRYNIQFSAQIEKTDSGSDLVEIWLVKNGNGVANTATQLTLAGNNNKEVAAWDFNVDAANVNDYFEIAWASPDTNVQLTAIDTANTISGIAVPSVILDINPIGA